MVAILFFCYIGGMKTYTVGFIFNPNFSKVLLVEKNRPDWQRGHLNGVGGHIEPGEESAACIAREGVEETNLKTRLEDWTFVGDMKTADWRVDVYAHIHAGAPDDAKTATDEKIAWHDVSPLPAAVLSNLHWLVPLSIDKLKHNQFNVCSVHYT